VAGAREHRRRACEIRSRAGLQRESLCDTNSDGNAEYGDDAVTRVVNLAPRADDGAMAVLQARCR
jgi:hypothetical protein